MKILPGTYKAPIVIIGIVGCAVILSCAYQQTGSGKGRVEITENGIVIHPTITLSPGDNEALDNALKHFSKSLYKIESLEKGQVRTARGSLSDAFMTAALKSEVANAKNKGYDVETDQFVSTNATGKKWAVTSASKELIAKVKPILEKYR